MEQEVNIPNSQWMLYVSSTHGTTPTWKWPVVAMVVLSSVVFFSMATAIMLYWKQHQRALEVVMVSARCRGV